MTKWEYMFVLVVGGSLVSVNDVKIQEAMPHIKKGTNIAQFANELGQEGWEFVMAHGEEYIFKRMCAETPA